MQDDVPSWVRFTPTGWAQDFRTPGRVAAGKDADAASWLRIEHMNSEGRCVQRFDVKPALSAGKVRLVYTGRITITQTAEGEMTIDLLDAQEWLAGLPPEPPPEEKAGA